MCLSLKMINIESKEKGGQDGKTKHNILQPSVGEMQLVRQLLQVAKMINESETQTTPARRLAMVVMRHKKY